MGDALIGLLSAAVTLATLLWGVFTWVHERRDRAAAPATPDDAGDAEVAPTTRRPGWRRPAAALLAVALVVGVGAAVTLLGRGRPTRPTDVAMAMPNGAPTTTSTLPPPSHDQPAPSTTGDAPPDDGRDDRATPSTGAAPPSTAPATTTTTSTSTTTSPPPAVRVPDVIAETEEDAAAELAEAGFVPVVVERTTCTGDEVAQVNFQRPEEGSTTTGGTVVQLLVGCVVPQR